MLLLLQNAELHTPQALGRQDLLMGTPESGGRILAIADHIDPRSLPLHPYTKALLASVPIPDPQVQQDRPLVVYEPRDFGETIWREVEPGHFVAGE